LTLNKRLASFVGRLFLEASEALIQHVWEVLKEILLDVSKEWLLPWQTAPHQEGFWSHVYF
jgi:hypothetical protein